MCRLLYRIHRPCNRCGRRGSQNNVLFRYRLFIFFSCALDTSSHTPMIERRQHKSTIIVNRFPGTSLLYCPKVELYFFIAHSITRIHFPRPRIMIQFRFHTYARQHRFAENGIVQQTFDFSSVDEREFSSLIADPTGQNFVAGSFDRWVMYYSLSDESLKYETNSVEIREEKTR